MQRVSNWASGQAWSRREAMLRLAAAGAGCWAGMPQRARADQSDAALGDGLTFFVVSDPQVHLDKWGVAGTEATIRTMNELPGKAFPLGGVVQEPRAVLVAGDLVDTVEDPRHWQDYQRMFDPDGKGLLRFRVFECIGNHDLNAKSAAAWSPVQEQFIERNRRRTGPEKFFFDEHHYHYSWDWGPLHLVNLNLFPGNTPRPVYDREAPWNNPRQSLDFLREDLRRNVGTSGRPVVLMWHYGLRGWGLEKWWLPEDLRALKEVIAAYRVVLILHGHEHAFAQYEWEGYPVFMCPSPQRDRNPETPQVASLPKGFLVVRLTGKELQLAHHHDRGWGETWRKTVL